MRIAAPTRSNVSIKLLNSDSKVRNNAAQCSNWYVTARVKRDDKQSAIGMGIDAMRTFLTLKYKSKFERKPFHFARPA
jgi:hypothetical protein